MNTTQHVCNYAVLRFLPYPETGEFVNVGVVVSCLQPCLFHFQMESSMPARAKALFPNQNEQTFEAAAEAMRLEMERVKGGIRNPTSGKIAFNEVVRPRESVLRFSEPRTIMTHDANQLVDELFSRYVRMETRQQPESHIATTR